MNAPATLLGISASLKGSDAGVRSASRALLEYALDAIGNLVPRVEMLDLRDAGLPLFDGTVPERSDNPQVRQVAEMVSQSRSLLLAVPCYWCGVSGVFKNFVDCTCGPAYDTISSHTAFSGKAVGVIVVGADVPSAIYGAEQAARILASAGAALVEDPLVVSNPRRGVDDEAGLSARLVALAALTAKSALQASSQRGARDRDHL